MKMREIRNNDVIQYFNERAGQWNQTLKKNKGIINLILDHCEIKENTKVLDVGCGTGILFDFYKERKADVIGIDISDKMVEIAKKSYPSFEFRVADASTFYLDTQFDAIVIYNAFPHFSNPEMIIKNLVSQLKRGGYFTIAHGLSREQINHIHHDSAMHVSNGLMTIDQLELMLKPYLDICLKISDERMYQIVGKKI